MTADRSSNATPDARRFDAVIFDLDGTLLDTERVAITAGLLALAELGHVVDPGVLRALVGVDTVTGTAILGRHLGVTLDHVRLDELWSVQILRAMDEGVPLMPGVETLLDELDAAGIPMAIATNSHSTSAANKLARSPIAGRIATVVAFDEVARGKPEPDVFLEAARRLGHPPRRTLVFEDSETGVAAARSAGMSVVHVPDIQKVANSAADHLAPDLLSGAVWAGLFAP